MQRFVLTSLFALTASVALAAGPMTAETIKTEIPGNTIGGGMSDGTKFSEFYSPDMKIFGKAPDGAPYTGTWSIKDNTMCFDYGTGATCYGLSRTGNDITFTDASGKVAGTGMLQPGNPQNLK
jgi:hypothetical protein